MLEDNLTPLYVRKKNLSPEVWGKKFLPKPNHQTPAKVKWSAPKYYLPRGES